MSNDFFDFFKTNGEETHAGAEAAGRREAELGHGAAAPQGPNESWDHHITRVNVFEQTKKEQES